MKHDSDQLANLINELSAYDTKFLDLSAAILQANHQNMYAIDLLSVAVLNRAIQLTNGFSLLAGNNNYLCAIPLIRMQLDNALRFYAFYLVQDGNKLFSHFIDGKPINRYRDKKGNLLTDNYLATSVDKIFPGVLAIYRNTSGHIHLSEQHLFATKEPKTNDKQPSRIAVGGNTDPFSPKLKINFASTMNEVNKLVYILLDQWRREKELKTNGPLVLALV
ncbi:hypothetical protein ACFFGT_04845 [Mucilaginibacter angelicae]|uniref:Uncharacterized protein n=1 Tax=Mucilaginibacter angelicae TaxID=869718 RepID=A0ABV6L2P0_9SPHI